MLTYIEQDTICIATHQSAYSEYRYIDKEKLLFQTRRCLGPLRFVALTLCVTMIGVFVLAISMFVRPPAVLEHETELEVFQTCEHIVDEWVYVVLAFPFLVVIVSAVITIVKRHQLRIGSQELFCIGKNFGGLNSVGVILNNNMCCCDH